MNGGAIEAIVSGLLLLLLSLSVALSLLKKQLGGLYVPISFDKLPVKRGRQAG